MSQNIDATVIHAVEFFKDGSLRLHLELAVARTVEDCFLPKEVLAASPYGNRRLSEGERVVISLQDVFDAEAAKKYPRIGTENIITAIRPRRHLVLV